MASCIFMDRKGFSVDMAGTGFIASAGRQDPDPTRADDASPAFDQHVQDLIADLEIRIEQVGERVEGFASTP